VSDSYSRLYVVIARIPPGRVATYGQVAAVAGLGGHARQVGYALHALPDDSDLPWQRVINAAGGISARGDVHRPDLQRELLETEGVAMRGGRIDLGRYRWSGPSREWRVALTVELPLSEGRFRHAGRRRGVKSTPR